MASTAAEARRERVDEGIVALDRWMEDLVRGGLARLEHAGSEPFERTGKRLIDAQARGVARWVEGLAAVPGSGPDWPARLLDELGRLALLTEAWRRVDALPEGLAAEVRRRVGFSVRQSDVRESGERVDDRWTSLGRREEDDDRFRIRRDWLVGEGSGRVALLLQFAHGMRPFEVDVPPGSVLEGTLAFWPAAFPQRALVLSGEPSALPAEDLPADPDLDAFLDRAAAELAADPWGRRTAGVVAEALPVRDGERWWLRDRKGRGVPLGAEDPWPLVAAAGGRPVTVAFEWDRRAADPIGVIAGGVYSEVP